MKVFEERTGIIKKAEYESISPNGEMLLFDIETTGLKKETTRLYLIGCGYFDDGEFVIRQWLTSCASDERAALEDFFEFARGFSVLVHFNGDGFDIPYIAYKADHYGLNNTISSLESVDIYKCFRPYKKYFGLERANQTAVEAFLGIDREDEMNGGLLIPYYYQYERTASLEAQSLLLLHNHDDVLGMLKMFPAMYYGLAFSGGFEFESLDLADSVMIIDLKSMFTLPKALETERGPFSLYAEDDLIQLNCSIKDGYVKVPVREYNDYYYFPQEDMIVHKDVAVFANRRHRRRASKDDCFLKEDINSACWSDSSFIKQYALKVLQFLI